MTTKTYKTFNDLPEWLASSIREFRPNGAETWIFDPVPALENQSIIEVINQGEHGIQRLRKYLNDLREKFFPAE